MTTTIQITNVNQLPKDTAFWEPDDPDDIPEDAEIYCLVQANGKPKYWVVLEHGIAS